MTNVVVMPLWQLLLIVTGVSLTINIPSTYWAGRRGARNAILTCSQHNDCALFIAKKNAASTQDLEKQLKALRKKNPEIAAVRAAMKQADENSGAVVVERVRAKEDKERDGT